MSTELQNNPTQQLAIAEATTNLNDALSTATVKFPDWCQRVARAKAALSAFTDIGTEQQDTDANNLLVKVRTTFDFVKGERTAITQKLDAFKEVLMWPEKQINTDPKATDSPYNLVKGLRDAFATKKANDAKLEADRIRLEQMRADEIVRVRTEFDRVVAFQMADMLSACSDAYAKAFNNVTLDTWETLEQLLNRTPALDPVKWATWFSVEYNKSLLTEEVYNGLVTEAKALFTYEASSHQFVTRCNEIIATWKAKLPAHKDSLEAMAKALQAQDEAAALKLKEEQEAAIAAQKRLDEEKAQAEAAEKVEAANQAQEAGMMENAFTAQAEKQTIEEPTGVRTNKTAVLTCEDEDIVAVISAMFYQVYINAKYPGIYKRDRQKNIKIDSEGNVEYVDWLQTMLNFYANNCNVPVPGIEVRDVTKSVQKATKA